MRAALEAYRATFANIEAIRAEAAEIGKRIEQMAGVDLPEAEVAAGKARDALKAAAGASALGEALDADCRRARAERDNAQERVDGLQSAIETLRKREREILAREKQARSEQRSLVAAVAEPMLRQRQENLAGWQLPRFIQALREIAQLQAAIHGNGFFTGEAYKRGTGDLAELFRASKLELNPTGIFHTLVDGRDELTPDQLLELAEFHLKHAAAEEPAA